MAKAAGAGGSTKQKYLTKEELLDQMQEQRATYELPGGGLIQLRSLDVKTGLDFFGTQTSDNQAISDRTKKICLLGIVEPELSLEDLEALERARFGAVNQIATKVLELSGMAGTAAADFLTPIPTSKA